MQQTSAKKIEPFSNYFFSFSLFSFDLDFWILV